MQDAVVEDKGGKMSRAIGAGRAGAGRAFRVISFDLDDTIWHCQPVLELASKAQHEWLVNTFPDKMPALLPQPKAFQPFFGKAFTEAEIDGKHYDFSHIRRRALHKVATEAGIDHELVVEPGFEAFLAARSTVRDHIFPGVIPVLERLKSQGFTLVSLTNGNCDLSRDPVLDALFEFKITAEDAGAAKPHQAPFQKVLDLAGVSDPSLVLHVGDSIESDVKGAKSFGMRTIWINQWGKEAVDHGAEAQVGCVSDIEPVINMLLESDVVLDKQQQCNDAN